MVAKVLYALPLVPLAGALLAPSHRVQGSRTLRQAEEAEVMTEVTTDDVVMMETSAMEAEVETPPATPAIPVPVRRVKNSDEWFMLALPFQNRPEFLDGMLAGDAGFDPAGLVTSRVDLFNYREAEIKHARLAMLCAAGWPLAELWDDGLAKAAGLPSIIAENGGRDPSILNGGLGLISPAYWLAVVALTGVIEYHSEASKERAKATDKSWMMTGSWIPGDLGFDPLGLYTTLGDNDRGKFLMETAEIKNGRLAMCAVLVYVVEEFITGKPVTELSPILFEPFYKVVEKLMFDSPDLGIGYGY